jgi:hypothetical protein
MAIEKQEWYETIFGKDFQVVIYSGKGYGQHKGHISMIVHPEDIEKVKEILKGNGARQGSK